MLRRVYLAIHAQDLLRARNRDVVDELPAVMGEAGAIAGAGEFGHPRAARAAVKIQTELRTEAAQRGQFRRQDIGNLGIALEDFAEAIFHEHAELQIGAMPVQRSPARGW